jgi:Ca-activated chloride channel family protein
MTNRTPKAGAFLLAALVAVAMRSDRVAASDESAPLSVRITSPMGRTGEPGTVRIVAQIRALPGAVLQSVQFLVDGTLLATVSDGPPYATDWIDANPFDPNEITVAVTDSLGNTARDAVLLKPFEVTETSEVTRVLLDASVQDKGGRFIRDLASKDFEVREDGIPQPLDLAAQEDLPATFALLVDSSHSMSRRIDFVREAASRLIGLMRARDRMLVVPFSKTLEPITGPTDDRATVSEAIARITPHGGTAILDCLIQLAPHLGGLEGRRVVVLITDGYDEDSQSRFEDALKAIKAVQATVYVVGIGGVAGISLKGERFLRKLAEETGGRAFLPSREEQLVAVHNVLTSDVQNRYLLSYTPVNQDVDGRWRAITVTIADSNYTVHARSGYFAPKPPPVRPSLEFTITDNERRFLEVDVDDLVVVENGVEQTVDTFLEAVAPVSIILALDASGSMKKAAEIAKAAAGRFVDALRAEDQLALVLFADRSAFAHDLGTAREKTHAAIAQYEAKGGTALYDALADSLERLKTAEGRRAIVVVTDGRDEDNPGTGPGSKRTFEQVREYAHEVDAAIFCIGVGNKVDRRVLEALAAASGGEAYFPDDVSQLEAGYRRVLETLRRRWIITYSSTDSSRDGAWRPVEIRTKDPNAVVHSRRGYFAPEKRP